MLGLGTVAGKCSAFTKRALQVFATFAVGLGADANRYPFPYHRQIFGRASS